LRFLASPVEVIGTGGRVAAVVDGDDLAETVGDPGCRLVAVDTHPAVRHRHRSLPSSVPPLSATGSPERGQEPRPPGAGPARYPSALVGVVGTEDVAHGLH